MTDDSRRLSRSLLALFLALTVAACGGGGDADDEVIPEPMPAPMPDPGPAEEPDPMEPGPASFEARGSVQQAWVVDAEPGTPLDLVAADGRVIESGTADDQGSYVFRYIEAASSYRVMSGSGADMVASPPFDITNPEDTPDPSFYSSQEVGPGYQYVEMRDGTLLAIMVRLPGPPEDGPYPTVIEYSGYDPANPDNPQPSTLITTALGYAAVGVNMRGTGCSGGTFEYFEPLQSTDGYDVVEIIAAQPWVLDNEVGMVGLSYPGISQLFVAQLNPPSLAAIAPLSVISDTGRGTLRPGGILNDGFALSWAEERRNDSMVGGQGWSRRRLDEGDQTCIDNMALRDQTPDIIAIIDENEFWVEETAGPLAPIQFVDRIDVPVFMSGAWQDEQVGGHFANMMGRFTGTDRTYFSVTNGGHTDPFMPAVFTRWMEFLSFYVAKEIPSPATHPILPVIFGVLENDIFRVQEPFVAEEPRYTDVASFEAALARFEAEEPRVRILFDNGAGSDDPGAPVPGFEAGFDAWPIPETEAQRWYFDEDGTLSDSAPAGDGADSYLYDDTRGDLRTLDGGTSAAWEAQPDWNWNEAPAGTYVAYASPRLQDDVVTAGSASVDLWIQSTAADTDLQVTLTELRPDGNEVYVQTGWLRTSRRMLDEAESTELRPVQTHTAEDAMDLPAGEFSLARVEIFPFAHAFRAGSRIRVVVGSPGGDRSHWVFDVLANEGDVVNTIGRSADHPSSLVLPVLPNVEVPNDDVPPCFSLRGQPCRGVSDTPNTPAS